MIQKCNTGYITDIELFNYYKKMQRLANNLLFFGKNKKNREKLIKKSSYYMAKANSLVVITE